jgi:glycerophosphoryl diester phosphodiesterase
MEIFMRLFNNLLAVAGLVAAFSPLLVSAGQYGHKNHGIRNIQVGPRPYYLVDQMQPSQLKSQLQSCSEGPFYKTDFSIGHRGGGTLQFPEHTKESHEAGARMGAGIQECDVTFTK